MATANDKSQKLRRVRLEDIAQRCEVSISTVSRALTGAKGVRPEIRRKVTEAALSARYPVAAGLAGMRVLLAASGAAMTDYIRNQFTWHVLDGLKARAAELGLEIVTRPIEETARPSAALLEALRDPPIRGLLLLTVDDEATLGAVDAVGKPVVLVNADDPWMRMSSVTPCNRSAARLATDFLAEQGHRRILFLMRPGRRTIERRLEGWRDSLRAHGLSCRDDQVVTVEDWLPDLAERALGQRLDRTGPTFDAVLCAGDSLAAGAIGALAARGIGVPERVSVMGMDDLPLGEFLTPRLTTVHIPMREIGATALDLLQERIAGGSAIARRVELACRIVVRGSVALARANTPAEPR